MCALLLDCGSDASQRDLTGRTAIEYAREKKLDYVVALLTCHGTAVADFARASWYVGISELEWKYAWALDCVWLCSYI